jgi:putative NIF3 family GTP cyclohydrolase 1 type 2
MVGWGVIKKNMTIQQIYQLALEIGIRNDFRSKKEIAEYLKRQKENFDKLSKEEKPYFDKEKLTNPYADTGIHNANGTKNIRKVLAGIDVSMGGILLAKELGVDLIINHHPVGKTLANLDAVMDMQVDIMEKFGIPVNIAEKLIHKRISEVARGVNPVNHYVAVDAARLLKINLMNIHTPADNTGAMLITKAIEKAKPKFIGEVIEVLEKIPEFQEAKKRGSGPILFSGNKENRAGKIVVAEFTGGTEGSKEIYPAMAQAGIGTVIAMHQSEDHRTAAEKANINVVVSGHISSDSIGMNIILDELEKKGLEIIPFAGLIRINRKRK